jgi:Na+-driven multidrug efflux pump
MIFGHWGFPQMGIAGAALASVISEALATVYLFFYTQSKKEFSKYGLFRNLKIDYHAIVQILQLSVFIMLQFFISISTWFLFFLFIERMGERPLAVTNIGRSMYILLIIPAHALSTTAGTLVSNMIGAGLTEEVLRTTHKLMRIAILAVAPFLIFTFFFPDLFAHIYSDDSGLILASLPVIKVVAVAVAFFTVGNIIVNAVSGTGNTKTALLIEVITLVFYVTYVYITAIVIPQPVYVVWMSEFVYWSLISILGYMYLQKGKWREKQI